jgi:hypothetical protein
MISTNPKKTHTNAADKAIGLSPGQTLVSVEIPKNNPRIPAAPITKDPAPEIMRRLRKIDRPSLESSSRGGFSAVLYEDVFCRLPY